MEKFTDTTPRSPKSSTKVPKPMEVVNRVLGAVTADEVTNELKRLQVRSEQLAEQLRKTNVEIEALNEIHRTLTRVSERAREHAGIPTTQSVLASARPLRFFEGYQAPLHGGGSMFDLHRIR